jgi:hypothetical protein
MTRLIVAFLNFGKAPNKGSYPSISVRKIYFSRVPELNRRDILYVIHAKYFGTIFGRKFSWKIFSKEYKPRPSGPSLSEARINYFH